MRRRHLLAATAASVVAPTIVLPGAVRAQAWPSKQVRILIPFAPGGTSDILARLLQPHLQAAFGQTVVIENRTGANGTIAVDMVAKAPADGHTVVLTDVGSLAIAPSVMKLPFDIAKDLSFVTVMIYSPHMLAVAPNFQANTIQELIAYAKANPGKINMATSGVGSAPHLAGAKFAHELGITWTTIPMKGGAEAIQQVSGGHADLLFNGMVATLPHVKNGKLKGLAVSSPKRHELAPELPTIAEGAGLKDFVTGSWQGFIATAGTPKPALERFQAEIARISALPDVAAKLKEFGAEALLYKPEQSDTWMKNEISTWAKVVKDTGVKLE
jgi:tripartite-type tricarboxylate transporter receptor subunit TctC